MLRALALAGLFSVSFCAQAELIPTDWRVANDKQATLDTTTGLEWLDLTLTAGYSYEQIAADRSKRIVQT